MAFAIDVNSSQISKLRKEYLWLNDAWLGLGDTTRLKVQNPLMDRTDFDKENPGLYEVRLMRNINYLHYAAKVLLGVNLLPMQVAILRELWVRPFPMLIASRGFSKSFMLALYGMLRATLHNDVKIVVVGAAFRQSKIIFEYMEKMWRQGHILRSVCDGNSGPRRDVDRCYMKINNSLITALPLGTGEKIRGMRANIILCDEFGSLDPNIYETVVSGFAAVSSDPVSNVQETAKYNIMKALGLSNIVTELAQSQISNQAILSGTAGYDFQHFANYWKKYCNIIRSRGNKEKLMDILGGEIPKNFNWKDYSVIRIPYELVPEGFMDDKHIARAKATVHSGVFLCEYSAVFTKDSEGFFKRSLIEGCVGTDAKPVKLPSGEICFDAKLKGDKTKKYVIGIDPASEQDNFSIVILELHSDHTRIVYCWTTNRKDFQRRKRAGLVESSDFYGFCARKIRSLMSVFPTEAIALDSQGGGVSVEEALHDPDKMRKGEVPIWPVIDDKKSRNSDLEAGLHILHLCNFANAEWTAQANHGLRKDFEDKVLLFPRFDPITLELSIQDDSMRQKAFEDKYPDKKFNIYDTLEDCMLEIEELKDELCTITLTRTGTGINSRDRWDTPEVKLQSGRKGRLRKDRYSALVMANMIARQIRRAPLPIEYSVVGGFANQVEKGQKGRMYYGPEWFTSKMTDSVHFGAIRR